MDIRKFEAGGNNHSQKEATLNVSGKGEAIHVSSASFERYIKEFREDVKAELSGIAAIKWKQITLNPQYEEIFDPQNLDEDCDTIADDISAVGSNREDEHYCYFDDMYSAQYSLQAIYEAIRKHDIGEEAEALLEQGHAEILDSECYQDYGYPSYIER